jgi:hypothetical protein
MMLIRAIAVWLVIIAAESVSGAIRRLWLIPILGDARSGRIGFVVGAIIIITIAWFFVRWMRAETTAALLLIGLLWAALTLLFEIALGRLVFDYSWARIAADYDITQGGLMAIGLVVLLFAPWIAAKLRGTDKRLIGRNGQVVFEE